jgi:hypothetical protein
VYLSFFLTYTYLKTPQEKNCLFWGKYYKRFTKRYVIINPMEKIKEKISYLKLWLTFLVSIDAGSVAWLFNRDVDFLKPKFIATVALIVTVTLIIAIIHRKTYKVIKSLGD